MSDEYRALVTKVEAFTGAASVRRRSDMSCQAGCSACCHAWLSVSPVEAEQIREGLRTLSPERRALVAARGTREHAREARGEPPRCAMLDDDTETCSVYAQRPLVCRTQGHALRYPAGFIPEAAVRARVSNGEVTHCPLNFQRNAPQAEDVLDAERVEQLLALVNHRFASARGEDPLARHTISELAAGADMLGCARACDE